MSKVATVLSAGLVALALGGAGAFSPMPAGAAPMSDADKAALKRMTDNCKAEVKEQAKYEAMSWWARHKAVKKCVKDTSAGGH